MAARRRLKATSVDGVRLNLGMGRGLYACQQLAACLGDVHIDQLRSIIEQLDAAEGRAQPS